MSIHQHFRKEEHPFIDQVVKWRDQVKTEYSFKLLDFLDPREQEIVQSIVGTNEEVKCAFWGGYEQAERKRGIIYPEYYIPLDEDFDIGLYLINYPTKFVTLEHRQILGSLMGLGLKRSKYGDILMGSSDIQFIITNQIAEYVKLHFNQVGKTAITLSHKPLTSIVTPNDSWQELTTTVSSMRLDNILAEVFRLSRQKVTPYIENSLVKVNWKTVDDKSYLCHPGDTLSMRGFGRCRLLAIEGQTKKEKWRIIVAKKK